MSAGSGSSARLGSRAARPVARVRPVARAVRVDARAKLNLGLAVGPRRRDGYHEIATLFQSVSLADTLTVTPRRAGFTLGIAIDRASLGLDSARSVPAGPDNSVLRAARLMGREFGVPGAAFRLVKRIPTGAGMGGGSADAGAAIRGLARLYGIRVRRARRLELGGRLGSDVPFACLGGTALGLGRGERLRPVRLARPFRAVVAVPKWRVSTALAYREIDRGKYGLTAWAAKLRFAQALGRDGVRLASGSRFGNTFELALGKRRADLESLRERLSAAGLQFPCLTGSGSAVFGIVRAGTTVRAAIARFEGSERLHVVRSTRSGARVTVVK